MQQSAAYAVFMTRTSTIQIRMPGRVSLNQKDDCGLFVLASAFLAFSLMCWSAVFEGPKLTLALAIIPLVLPFMVAYAAMTERGILDPTALFPALFGAYNGVLLIRFLSDDVRHHIHYPVKFDPDVYFQGGLLSALGAIFITITWALWKPPAHKNLPKHDLTGWFKVGTIFYALGILLYLLQYLQIGGYWAALAIDRTKRFEVMTEVISLPYFGFVLVGLVMTTASGSGARKRAATIMMTGLWCVMVMAQGDRRLLLQTVLAVLSASTFLVAKSNTIRMRHLLLAIVAYVALAVAGQLREQVPWLVSDTVSQHTAHDSPATNSLLDSAKPENSELAGPFLSVLYNAEHVRDYSFGASYVDTIFSVLPRIFYRPKPPSPAEELANALHRGRIFGFPVAGWGYSPIAEAFLNFGIPGVCIISSLWMAAFIVLSKLRSYRWGLVTAAVLSPESINANRIDFRTVYLETFFCTAVVLLAAVIVRSLYLSSPRIRHRVTETRTLHQAFQQSDHVISNTV
jgi:hypothetical protein